MPLLLPRQLPTPSGSTIIPAIASGTALSTDSVHTGTLVGLSAPTLIFSTTESQTTSTVFSASPVAAAAAGVGGSSINTPTIIGLIVGVFVFLAATLIVFMTIRHRKRNSIPARALSSARKSWSRLKEDPREPPAAEMQMRSTTVANTGSVAVDTNSPTSHGPFLSHNSVGPVVSKDPSASSPDNPTHQQTSGSGRTYTHSKAVQSESHGTHESHIPNPFESPLPSPSPSRSPSHTSTRSTNASSVSHAPNSNFVQYLPQYSYAHSHNTSMVTASSISEYPDEFPAHPNNLSAPPKAAEMPSEALPVSAPVFGKRTRELKAMQDLISALDDRAQNKKEAAAPSSFNFTINTNVTGGSSRLSMGEGLVTPGGHSLREEDVVMKYNQDAYPYRTNAQKSTVDDDKQGHFPLSPTNAEPFRATLSPGARQEKENKLKEGKKEMGKGAPPNPSLD